MTTQDDLRAAAERPADLPADCQWIPRDKSEPRVETGPLAFGSDWPGVFIRGDNAGWYAMLLGQLLAGEADALAKMQLRGLHDDLRGCIIGPAKDCVPTLDERPIPTADELRELREKAGNWDIHVRECRKVGLTIEDAARILYDEAHP
jgi:hypothetical protein